MSNNRSWRKSYQVGAIFLCTLIITLITSNYHPSSAETDQVHWEYSGESNAYVWGLLSPEFQTCTLGDKQSPINITNIDIDDEQPGELAEIKFDYQSSAAEVVNNGHTIQVNYKPGNSVSINNQKYKLLQFHFHTPSEHKIDDKSSAMEAHFVHQNDAGELAVVGVMMNSGAENPQIAQIWQAIPEGNKANKAQSITLNAAKLLPSDKTYVSYEGSLTTPPCSEGVSWNLLLEPIEVSSQQIATFTNLYQNNARPIQALNDRSVELHQDSVPQE
ncbi:MAG: carbonic anhydrase family protein [Cyanobacteria bacterium P01_G01_bin.39]